MTQKGRSGAKTMPMRILEDRRIPYEPRPQAHKQYTAQGVADDLGVSVAQVVKAMIVQRSDGRFALVMIPGDQQLSLKKVSTALQDKQAALAQTRDVERVTGYQLGAVSVLGFRRQDLACYLDRRVLELDQVIISAGRPDMGLALSARDLQRALDRVELGDFCQEG